MKKYIKPVMESESFVANEYIGACWTMTCTNSDGSCGTETWRGEKNIEGLTLTADNTNGVYSGDINGNEACREKFKPNDYNWTNTWQDFFTLIKYLRDLWSGNTGTTTKYHPVSVTEGWTNHPNAS